MHACQDQAQVTLNDDLLFIPLARLSSTSKHPLIVFPKLWSEFPDERIKLIRNLNLILNSKITFYHSSNQQFHVADFSAQTVTFSTKSKSKDLLIYRVVSFINHLLYRGQVVF
jgi:hypothetical protein